MVSTLRLLMYPLLLILSCLLGAKLQEVIVHVQPSSVSVCVKGSTIFTCTVSRPDGEITSARWEILNMAGDFASVMGRDRHILNRTISSNGHTLIENLTIIDVTIADNGASYRCNPVPLQLFNNTASLNVAGSPSSVTDLVVPPNKITPTSFVAQWSKPSSSPVCGPVQYMVTVSTTGGVVISNRTINRTTFTATNLSDNTQYKINITAINKGGNGISASAETTTRNGDPPRQPHFKFCLSYNHHQPALKIFSYVMVDFHRMSMMLRFITSYQTGTTTVTDATCSGIQNNIQYNCTAEFTVDINPSVEIMQSVKVTVSGPYGNSSSVMEVEERANAIISIVEEDISQESAILECRLACFSITLQCKIINTTAPTSSIGSITGSVTSYNYPTQLLMFSKLKSGTTYNYSVVAINMSNMVEVGDPVCGTFKTQNGSDITGVGLSNGHNMAEQIGQFAY
ncbi:uncharacterized protein [Dysidea avara]|uniref:uncharacterized protein n=1 Tax=Dysidea avara TaxID=196820 RepID=UPI003330DF12